MEHDQTARLRLLLSNLVGAVQIHPLKILLSKANEGTIHTKIHKLKHPARRSIGKLAALRTIIIISESRSHIWSQNRNKSERTSQVSSTMVKNTKETQNNGKPGLAGSDYDAKSSDMGRSTALVENWMAACDSTIVFGGGEYDGAQIGLLHYCAGNMERSIESNDATIQEYNSRSSRKEISTNGAFNNRGPYSVKSIAGQINDCVYDRPNDEGGIVNVKESGSYRWRLTNLR